MGPERRRLQTDTATSVPNGSAKVTGTLNGRTFSGTASNLSTAVVGAKAVLKGTLTAAGLGTTSFTANVNAVTAAPPPPPAGGLSRPSRHLGSGCVAVELALDQRRAL